MSSRYFFSDYFAVSKFCHTFVAVNELATTYQDNSSMQGILKFFASFCADYLVNPNNLLTHTHTQARRILRFARTRAKDTINITHTHTQAHLASNHTFFAFSYARAKRGVSPINKGLSEVPFVRFFMPFYQPQQKANNNEFRLKNNTNDE